MSVWTDFENWRDGLHCGGEPEEEWREAEIEQSLNDSINDIWWWRRVA